MNETILIPPHSLNYILECSWALEFGDPNFKLTLGVEMGGQKELALHSEAFHHLSSFTP